MTTDLDERLRHYGESFERAVQRLPLDDWQRTRTVQAPARNRDQWALVVALLAAVVIGAVVIGLVVALPKPDSDDGQVIAGRTADLTDYRDKTNGFSVEYPESWTRAEVALAPGIIDAKEILSVGTYPLRAGSTTCTQGPENAIADLPSNGALVTVQERTDRMLYPARSTFTPFDESQRLDEPSWCVSGDVYEHWWLTFDDHDRSFQVLVAIGIDADAETRDDAWRVISSLKFDIPAASAVPNHVSESLYGTQALGATMTVGLPDGTYETAVRVDDHICLDLRPRGAPSGPQICDIPANGPWPTPVMAGTVVLNGTRYLIGVASDQVTSAELADDPAIPIGLIPRQPFPTLRFFALAIGGGRPVTLNVSTRTEGVVTVNAEAQ